MTIRLIKALIFFSLISIHTLFAQQTDFERWRQAQQQELNQFSQSQDDAFSAFLRQSWISVTLLKDPTPTANKPPAIPRFEPAVREPLRPVIPEVNITSIPDPSPVSLSEVDGEFNTDTALPTFPSSNEASTRFTAVDALGVELVVPVISYYAKPLTATLTNETIANHWDYLAAGPYSDVISYLTSLRSELNWNDWATAMHTRSIAQTWTNDENSVVALTWFLLSKLGYRAQVGYQSSALYLLIASTQPIYEVPKITLDQDSHSYYLVRGLNARLPLDARIYTYKQAAHSSSSPIELNYSSNPRTYGNPTPKEISFILGEDRKTVTLSYDKQLVDFLASYPQTHPALNFNLPPSPSFVRSMREQIQPLIAGKSEVEALNILLRLVQTGFEYKTDTEQFGRQRFMIPDESMFYPYSDCDDRAILFSWLVRLLLDLEVVGLEYPGHIATAVRLNTPVSGDHVLIQGEPWLICDPTYIMADIGHLIPDYASLTPKVILTN
jgi:hypothetical protein